jgi:hypothetical protein
MNNVPAAPQQGPRGSDSRPSAISGLAITAPNGAVRNDRTTSLHLQEAASRPIGMILTPGSEKSTVQIKRDLKLFLAALGDCNEEINPDQVLQAAALTHQWSLPSMRQCHGKH